MMNSEKTLNKDKMEKVNMKAEYSKNTRDPKQKLNRGINECKVEYGSTNVTQALCDEIRQRTERSELKISAVRCKC